MTSPTSVRRHVLIKVSPFSGETSYAEIQMKRECSTKHIARHSGRWTSASAMRRVGPLSAWCGNRVHTLLFKLVRDMGDFMIMKDFMLVP
jgi:hypothetical protein